MRSIQGRLTTSLLTATALLAIGATLVLYAYLRSAFIDQLDRSLKSEAALLSSAVEINAGVVSFDNLPAFGDSVQRAGHARDFFEIWRVDGTPLFRSASLTGRDLPFHPTVVVDSALDVRVPNGPNARGISVRFQPFSDDLPAPASKPSTAVSGLPLPAMLILSIAHDRSDVDERLHLIAVALATTTLISLAMVALLVPLVVRKALQPVRQIVADADRIDAQTLNGRFNTDDSLPTELLPISVRLNELMDRLQQAFKREKRFTADAAHELRTPVAELRALTEVALKWPADQEVNAHNFRQALAIARQMESIITALLRLARSHSRQESVSSTTVRLREILADAWSPYRSEAESRCLQMNWDASFDAMVVSDVTMLTQILSNLFSNAVHYAPAGSEIHCSVLLNERSASIVLTNRSDSLTEKDLQEMFQPFWRKDQARTSQTRVGLGLAIASAYATALGHKLDASLQNGRFQVTVEIPCANSQLATLDHEPLQARNANRELLAVAALQTESD